MPTTKDQGLSRDDVLHILKGMNIELNPNTKLSSTKLQHRLGKALDAAQRFSSVFENAEGGINPSDYASWKKKSPVVDALTRRTWGAMFQTRGFEDQRQIAFTRITQLIPDIGKEIDKKKIAYVIVKDKIALRALIINFFSIYEINEKTPLILVNYATISGMSDQSLDDALAALTPENMRGMAYQMTEVEQNLLVELFSQNRKHLSPAFDVPDEALDERFKIGFIIPIGGLNMKDIARLSKNSGCVLCGENTHSTCSACLSVQYCGKDCQREDWKAHKPFCRSIASGKWYTVTLDPNPFSALMSRMYTTGINRYDDLDEPAAVKSTEDLEDVPPNYYDNDYYLVKLQVPLGGKPTQMLVYDRYKTFEVHLTDSRNPEAFTAALAEIGDDAKMYRWAKRAGDWEWEICFNRAPDRDPLW